MRLSDKMGELLVHLVETYPEPGTLIDWRYEWNTEGTFIKANFPKPDAIRFFMDALVGIGALENVSEYGYYLTISGFERVFKAQEGGANSNICFVAMSFDKTDEYIYLHGIKPALESTGFIPFKVDEYHPDAEQTINDAIIAGIKRSRFVVADFTKHKKGVYFEAGYALGRGLKVIYTCRNDQFQDSHFDTNHYPHILYDTPEELQQKLIAKIEAWIKE